jgi:dolichol kinase
MPNPKDYFSMNISSSAIDILLELQTIFSNLSINLLKNVFQEIRARIIIEFDEFLFNCVREREKNKSIIIRKKFFFSRLLPIIHLTKEVQHNFSLILIEDGLVLVMIMSHHYSISRLSFFFINCFILIRIDVENRRYF